MKTINFYIYTDINKLYKNINKHLKVEIESKKIWLYFEKVKKNKVINLNFKKYSDKFLVFDDFFYRIYNYNIYINNKLFKKINEDIVKLHFWQIDKKFNIICYIETKNRKSWKYDFDFDKKLNSLLWLFILYIISYSYNNKKIKINKKQLLKIFKDIKKYKKNISNIDILPIKTLFLDKYLISNYILKNIDENFIKKVDYIQILTPKALKNFINLIKKEWKNY